AVKRLEALARARGIAHPPFTLSSGSDGKAASIELPLTGAGDNAASRHAISVLRHDLIPQTVGRLPGVETAVTGDVAEDVDFTGQMKHGIPYVIGFVLALAFLLLLVAFRSLVVPLKAIVLNLLSVGAAYGVLVLVFQHHWAESLLGFRSNGAIISWLLGPAHSSLARAARVQGRGCSKATPTPPELSRYRGRAQRGGEPNLTTPVRPFTNTRPLSGTTCDGEGGYSWQSQSR